jgi:hypothetical protein
MKRNHPYVGLPNRQFWTKDPGIATPSAFDPLAGAATEMPFRLTRSDKVVTAGSCFAQHLARGLVEAGFNHLVTEKPHPIFNAEVAAEFNYGTFTARYGNIYTARQFLQLLHRAYGQFVPIADAWTYGDSGRVVDPFRPQIQPHGFVSATELTIDRRQHFAAIRTAIETMDVLVFTLGLTECWEDPRDGAIFPLAPGVAGGFYEPTLARFRNFDAAETTADLTAALAFVRQRNPGVKILLTVSPVPLNATFEGRHVWVSTTYSKAVLRVAAEACCTALPDCVYFPSYEIITSPQARGRYYGPDCRTVLRTGVAHVMRVFFKHCTEADESPPAPQPEHVPDQHQAEMERMVKVFCDEESISNQRPTDTR